MDTWRGLLACGEPGEEEARLRRFDGEYRWFLFRAVPVRDEQGVVVRWYGTNTEIEDLKRAEERHQGDQRQIRRIIDAIPQQIVILGPDGATLYANQAVLDYTGLSVEEVQREDFRVRVFHPEDVAQVRDERQKALARGVPFELEQRALRKDGQYRWFSIRYKPLLDEQGRVLHWYATGTDIEDHKQAEERMRNENLALREEIDRASMFEEIVGSSEALRKVLRQVAKVAPGGVHRAHSRRNRNRKRTDCARHP